MSQHNLILVVDDDVDIRNTLRMLLEDEGYSVLTAADGCEALELLRRGAVPRLVLLDVMMPRCNGYQFRAEQSRDPALAAIPIVVLTADAHIQHKARPLGDGTYLAKPIALDQLLAVVARFCPAP